MARSRGGGIEIGGNAGLHLAGLLDNRSGLIGVGSALTLNARTFDNRDTQTPDTGLYAGALALNLDTLDNRLGRIWVVEDAGLGIADTLDNQSGQIESGQDLLIRSGESLNTDGQLLAGRGLSLTTHNAT